MKTIHFTVVHTRYVGWTLSQDVRLMLKHPQGMTYVYIIRVLRDIVEGYSTKRALVTVCCANIITLWVLFRFRTKPLGHLMACRFFFQSIGNWNKSKIESIFKFLVADCGFLSFADCVEIQWTNLMLKKYEKLSDFRMKPMRCIMLDDSFLFSHFTTPYILK